MHFVHVELDIDIAVNSYELFAEQDLLAIILQRLAVDFAFDFGSVLESCFQRAEALDEFDGPLVADTGRAGNVVDGIATQCHDVDYASGRHAKNFFDLGSIADQIVFRWIEDQDAVVHQLQHIFVAGDDVHRSSLCRGLFRKCADDVIGFVSGNFEYRNAIGFESTRNVRNLLGEISGHLAAVSFVVLVLLVAKCGCGDVEDRREVMRRKVVAQLA